MPLRRAAAAILLAASFAGCGSSGSSQSPTEVVKAYLTAVAAADAKKACGYLVIAAGGRCDISEKGRAEAARALLRGTFKAKAEANGEAVTATAPGYEGTFGLLKDDDRWKIVLTTYGKKP